MIAGLTSYCYDNNVMLLCCEQHVSCDHKVELYKAVEAVTVVSFAIFIMINQNVLLT